MQVEDDIEHEEGATFVPHPTVAAPASGSLTPSTEPTPLPVAEEELEPTVTVDSDELDQPAPSADLVRVYLDAIGRTPLLSAAEEVELSERIEAGLYAAELLRQHQDGETGLDERMLGDLAVLAELGAAAKRQMISANLRLVVSVARKFPQRGVPLLDVIQEGNLGLIRAVEKFDYRKGYKFSTYATWWIRQAIGRGLADQARSIRLPVHVNEEVSKIARASRRLLQQHGRDATDAEIAAETGLEESRVAELRVVGRDVVSLDTPVGDGEDTVLGDLVADGTTPSAESIVEERVRLGEIDRVLEGLPERERLVIRLRFGLYDGRQHTLDEVGRHFGLTRERIRQIEKHTLARLRHPSSTERLLEWAS